MERLIIIVMILFVNTVTFSQIAAAEYFIDTDPGAGNASSLAVSGTMIDQNFTISTSGLSDGIHKLYVRVRKDDGTWGFYGKNVFYINSNNSISANIASAEYFIDTDPGVGNGSSLSVSGNLINQNFSIPTTGLSDGVHQLYIRVINENGTWGLYDKNVFFVNSNNLNLANIASAEYFIDADPGVGNGSSLSVSGNMINQNFNIPTSGLSNGVHQLYIRVINENGTWSFYDQNIFFVTPNNSNSALITAAEYFFDIDPGLGNATSIDFDDLETIDEDLEIQTPSDLSDGDHYLYIRVQNTNGVWSLYATSEMLSTLSTSDFGLSSFKFYPNPVKDVLCLKVQNQEIISFKVIDLTGKIIVEKQQIENQIDLSHLSSGVYLFHLKTDAGIVSKKFIKE